MYSLYKIHLCTGGIIIYGQKKTKNNGNQIIYDGIITAGGVKNGMDKGYRGSSKLY